MMYAWCCSPLSSPFSVSTRTLFFDSLEGQREEKRKEASKGRKEVLDQSGQTGVYIYIGAWAACPDLPVRTQSSKKLFNASTTGIGEELACPIQKTKQKEKRGKMYSFLLK